jgi:hypothetical protein
VKLAAFSGYRAVVLRTIAAVAGKPLVVAASRAPRIPI